jgi:hypothetical protein
MHIATSLNRRDLHMKKKKLNEVVPFGDKKTNLEWFKYCPNCGKPMEPIVLFLVYFDSQSEKIPYKQFDHMCEYCALGYQRVAIMTDEEYDYACKNLVFDDALDMDSYVRFKEKVRPYKN